MDNINQYKKLLTVNLIKLEYPFNNIQNNIELTKNQLELYYIKKYNKCVKTDKKDGGNEKSKIMVFL